jgi:endonuclease/exonuclease/phosphatase family metal-dependent hydrolase
MLAAPSGASGAELRGAEEVSFPLRIMTFNILYGGDELNLKTGDFCTRARGCPSTLAKVIETIQASGADIVGLEEAEHNTRTIANALGWFASERLQIISRYPLIDPPKGRGIYIFARITPGRVVALANVHLPSDPYGPYLVRDGGSAKALRELERTVRLPAIHDQLRVLPTLARRGIPVFLTGDFNSPSHLDWTAAVAAVRPEVRFPFDWPVSRALANAGFRDSYRQVHPDPVAVRGFTWTPGGPETDPHEVHDRIDWVLARRATAVASKVVGEAGGPDVDIAVAPYPTDHRGVVSTFDVNPGRPPVLVAVEKRRLSPGQRLAVVFHAPGRSGEQVAIVHAGGTAAEAGDRRSTGALSPTDGALRISTSGLGRGAYEAVLIDHLGAIVSRSPFWLYRRGESAKVSAFRRVYRQGRPIRVSWSNAPGMRWDWVAVYRTGGRPSSTTCNVGLCGNGDYFLYEYTHASIAGRTSFSAHSGTWPLKPGSYEVRLLLDDGYRLLARSRPFRVVKR